MQKAEVIVGLLVPADKQSTKAVEPGVGAFYHPSARPLARLLSQLLRFLSSRLDVSSEAELHQRLAHLIVVVPLVQAYSLRLFFRRSGSLHHNTLDGGSHQLHV